MTRPIRKGKGRRGKYEPLDFDFLREGPHGLPCILTRADEAGDEAAIERAWGECESHIMRGWFKHHAGCRPWGWWHVVGHKHGRRERIDGKVHPFDNPLRSLVVANTNSERAWRRAYSLRFGMPAIHIPPHDDDVHRDFMQNVLLGKESTIFEPEWSFLVRHGLLVDEDSP